ncbi:MAG: MBL fold metallo-hydrolase [Acidobacteria bacterium]|nr:MAG: MBL fold metallo-hydrolase [Acidobacteriota bacterium]
MIVDRVQHPGWLVNSWLVAGREEGRGILIDTGADPAKILEMVRRHGVRVVAIIATHRHYDHVAGNEFLARNLGAPVLAHRLERPHIPTATEDAEPGRRFEFRGWHAEIVAIPGHTAGQIGVHVPGHAIFTGDTLFKGSVGGTVAPGHTTFEDLRRSVLETILSLPGDTKIHPGHGESSTVAHELERNPFVRVWRGLDEPGTRPGRVDGKRVTVEVWAKDYDGGHKAQVRFADGSVAIVPGSRVQKVTL